MKTIIKLLIAVAFLNAVYRYGMATWEYYQFKDGTQQLLLFGGKASTEQLHTAILARAEEMELPVAYEQVTVRREARRTTAEAFYVSQVEVFPRYKVPVKFSFSVEIRPTTAEGIGP